MKIAGRPLACHPLLKRQCRLQTLSTGLQHPSSKLAEFGGRCRKAMLGMCVKATHIILVPVQQKKTALCIHEAVSFRGQPAPVFVVEVMTNGSKRTFSAKPLVSDFRIHEYVAVKKASCHVQVDITTEADADKKCKPVTRPFQIGSPFGTYDVYALVA